GLTRLLDENTAEGFVFRVDTRLRPFGQSGQLALSFDAMEVYYERHGREWERYAMIKARVISGSQKHGDELLKRLKPFIYRRYIDFSAFESLREMKQLIVADVKRKGLEDNIKLGSGGIREIEFIGQAFQLIRGGQEKRLQDRRIQRILDVLGQMKVLPVFVVEHLIEAYRFLRLSENRIQAYADQQTHLLPKDEIGQLRLACAMGFENWRDYRRALDQHRSTVQEHFSQIFAAPQAEEQENEIDITAAGFVSIWFGRIEQEEAQQQLTDAGFKDGKQALNLINGLRDGRAVRALTPRARTRLDRLMPMLIHAVAAVENADECLLRVLNLLEAVVRRSVYIALLIEHPVALSQFVRLFSISPWVAQQLTRQPVLLDELLDPRRLYAPMLKDELSQELEIRMAAVDTDDLEGQMDALRQFRHANVLRVAASQLTNAMPLAKVSDHLTFIAEVVMKEVLKIALYQMNKRHGIPRYVIDGETHTAGFAIIAYGKTGGWELGFGSDLDVVFLHDSHGEQQQTDGERCIDNATFFARLGQRIIHILSTQTSNGVLYEVDTRLRPSGKSGLLVSSVKSYADYQQNQAWTWEHQALIRARWVAGSESIAKQFAEIRREVLCRKRDQALLAGEVQSMRVRMRESLGSNDPSRFDLKQDIGGITDIEFIIQYLVLRWAAEFPQLIEYTDNLRIIETLAKIGKLTQEDADFLTRTYLTYRHTAHELTLAQAPSPTTDEQRYFEYREGVTRIWNKVLEV
ncbi:MAG: bifunctional [glutamate--ammonia ligase]-adenylyl-L-tyrosine phosphorylase/[glutamate--ammonia-ligase] adenylyltransferase, partial [Gammaproteobacteria bacterium]|nr:bifunctional [glutamate--ammonia ligase]-adenylyl-L-tyrosine phosphorylase/[glutamate--ammonia-ligase] adenylyltransferase [Gammaproteobacteria bacterium]